MIRYRELTDRNKWESFVSKYEWSNFLQGWEWGEFHESINNDIERIGFYNENKLIGVMLFIVEHAKRATYATVPAGPLIDWNDKKVLKCFVSCITELSHKYNCSFVRIRPQLLNEEKNSKLITRLGFKPAPMHLHAELTLRLNLEKSEEQLMAEMRKNTRYEVRKAEKLGIVVTKSTDSKEVDAFYKLQEKTAKRNSFVPFSLNYLKKQFEIFRNNDKVAMYTAKLGNKMLAKAFIIFYGNEAIYHYGASSDLGRKYPGAYLLLWEIAKEAKAKGMKYFNFWGITKEEEVNHRFYGVSLFKRGFGGEEIDYLHARDYVIDKPKYLLNFLVEEVRKKVRRL